MIKRTFAAAAAGTALIMTGGLAAACSATSPAAPARLSAAHFSAPYVEDGVDRWTCSGTHVISKDGRAKDTETCLITGNTTGYAKMVGTFTGHPYAKLPLGPPRPWHSDYNHAKAGRLHHHQHHHHRRRRPSRQPRLRDVPSAHHRVLRQLTAGQEPQPPAARRRSLLRICRLRRGGLPVVRVLHERHQSTGQVLLLAGI